MGKPGHLHPVDKDTVDMSQLFLSRSKGETSDHGASPLLHTHGSFVCAHVCVHTCICEHVGAYVHL